MPARLSLRNPRPATSGFGSVIPATTSLIPATISARVHGGVRPIVAARLQVDVESRATRFRARALERDDLRMIAAGELMETRGNDLPASD